MNRFDLARMRHVDLLALIYLMNLNVNELGIAPYNDNARPVCSKENLVSILLEHDGKVQRMRRHDFLVGGKSL